MGWEIIHDDARDVVDQTGDRRPLRASVYALVSGTIADDDAARIADLHRALLLYRALGYYQSEGRTRKTRPGPTARHGRQVPELSPP